MNGSKIPMRAVVIILLVVTFPLWIGILAGIFGAVFGLIGGAIGLVFGVFGAVIGAIGAVIGGIFEFIFHPWDHGHFMHFNTVWFAVIFIAIVVLISSRKKVG